jgi:hypothetical protein
MHAISQEKLFCQIQFVWPYIRQLGQENDGQFLAASSSLPRPFLQFTKMVYAVYFRILQAAVDWSGTKQNSVLTYSSAINSRSYSLAMKV